MATCQRYHQPFRTYFGVKAASAYSRIWSSLITTMRATPALVYKDLANNVSRVSTFTAGDVRTDNRTAVALVGSSASQFEFVSNNVDADVGFAVQVEALARL